RADGSTPPPGSRGTTSSRPSPADPTRRRPVPPAAATRIIIDRRREQHMTEATEIPSFRPSSGWYEDWPFDVDTSVQVEATVTGPAADRAVERFLEPLTEDLDASLADGGRVHYRGGFTVASAPAADGDGW